MHEKKYFEMICRKFMDVANAMSGRIFREIGEPETVYGLEMMDHRRMPPEYSEMKAMEKGEKWGVEFGSMWLRTSVTVPESADGEIFAVIPGANANECLCFKNGIASGIINSKNNFAGGMHSAMIVDASAKAGDTFDIAFECYAGHGTLGTAPYHGYGYNEDFVSGPMNLTYEGVKLAVLDTVMMNFVFDTLTVLQLLKLETNCHAPTAAHRCIEKAYPYLIQDHIQATYEELYESCRKISEILAPALKKDPARYTDYTISYVGHSHMDTAWLWPVSETVRKCARTYSQVLTYMDMYPDYIFIQSSALHLDWMREYYPELFERIRAKVAEGRFELNGGCWVELDCNITGGESMIRQFLYGQRFTKEHFGVLSDTFWLPDTFGYSAAIPQILKGCGMKYFCTTKMGWNDLNESGVETFLWRGIDGSGVLTHYAKLQMTPDPSTTVHVAYKLTDDTSCCRRLCTYGYGDGGGGPTYGQLEYLKRTKDLPSMPKVETPTVSQFFTELEELDGDYPVKTGELYLEKHRGTLTTMHDIKENNRRGEEAMHDLELLNVLSGQKTSEKHDELMKTLLINQFHDILPGTCIYQVNRDVIPEMKKLVEDTGKEADRYASLMTVAEEGKVSVFNQLSFERDDIVIIDGEEEFEGKVSQTYTDVDGKKKTALHLNIPSMSAVTLTSGEGISAESPFIKNGNHLSTPYYDVELNECGYITSLIDKELDRQLVREGGYPLGTLWIGEDMPSSFDSWDIDKDIFLKLKPISECVSTETVSDGALEYRVRSEYKIGKRSTATVVTVFYSTCRRIDYETKIDWRERHHLLKVGFDLNIHSDLIKNEIQFGHIDRPTTCNNSWEAAKFEVCNHKWSDISETRYGVALLNDCKYGLSAEAGHLRLTLEKGGCRPDPICGFGEHKMKYSLLPHEGPFNAENVVYPAYWLNYSPIIVSGKLNAPKLFELSAPGVICETVKPAEDADGAYVLRLYECERNSTGCTVTFSDAKRVWVTDMLENKKEELALENGSVKLKFRPFEIKTVLVER